MELRSTQPLVVFKNTVLGYENHIVLDEFNLEIHKGDFTAIVGSNGSGKSTLVKSIIGELKPFQGSLHRNFPLKTGVSYLPQMSHVDRFFPVTVKQLVSMALLNTTGLFGKVNVIKTRSNKLYLL